MTSSSLLIIIISAVELVPKLNIIVVIFLVVNTIMLVSFRSLIHISVNFIQTAFCKFVELAHCNCPEYIDVKIKVIGMTSFSDKSDPHQ